MKKLVSVLFVVYLILGFAVVIQAEKPEQDELWGIIPGGCFLAVEVTPTTIVIDDWTLDLTNIDGVGVVVKDIAQITFEGVGHQQLLAFNSDGSADGVVDGLLQATSLHSSFCQ